jgi:anti-sigma regulatory factor (Ser/Thr protein kinase)
VLDDASLTDAHDVCRAHSNVQAPRVYAVETASAASETDLQSEVFLPVPLAVPAARHFTTAVLRQWQLEALVEDAALIVTELGANAVAHAATPFRIRVRRDADTLRLEVHDTALTKPEQRAVEPADFHGRGLALIDALAQAWGYDQTPDGKRVWARLTARH